MSDHGLNIESLVGQSQSYVTSDSKLSPLSLCMCIQGEVVDTYVYQGLKVESLVTVYVYTGRGG